MVVNFVDLFEKTLTSFIDFFPLYFSNFYVIYFSSIVSFISFLLLVLDLVCSFSSSFRCKFRLLICDLSFLM